MNQSLALANCTDNQTDDSLLHSDASRVTREKFVEVGNKSWLFFFVLGGSRHIRNNIVFVVSHWTRMIKELVLQLNDYSKSDCNNVIFHYPKIFISVL